jgi:hypothetical protein
MTITPLAMQPTTTLLDSTVLSDTPGHPNNGDRRLTALLYHHPQGFRFEYSFETCLLGEKNSKGNVEAESITELRESILLLDVPFFSSHREYSGEQANCMTLRGLANWYVENIAIA